jgi:hypothetical protein
MSGSKFKFLSVLMVLAFVSDAFGVVITSPPSLPPGTPYRLAFISEGGMDSRSTDIEDYNTFVTQQANLNPALAILDTTWKAIGSTASVDARDNTGTNPSSVGFPIFRLDGLLIANGNADLWDGAIQNPLGIEQFGNPYFGAPWTGTNANGTKYSPYALGQSQVVLGLPQTITSDWILGSGPSPLTGNAARLYAVSGVLVSPGASVPEPGSILIYGLASLSLFGWKLKKRERKMA